MRIETKEEVVLTRERLRRRDPESLVAFTDPKLDYLARAWARLEGVLQGRIAAHLDVLCDFLPLMELTSVLAPTS